MLPGGPWIDNSKNTYIQKNQVFTHLKNDFGQFVQTSADISQGPYKNKNGRLVKTDENCGYIPIVTEFITNIYILTCKKNKITLLYHNGIITLPLKMINICIIYNTIIKIRPNWKEYLQKWNTFYLTYFNQHKKEPPVGLWSQILFTSKLYTRVIVTPQLSIPKVVYRTGPMDYKKLPAATRTVFDNFTVNNPSWGHVYLSDYDCIGIIKQKAPGILPLYNNLLPGAYRADIMRYILMFFFGGVYMDINQSLLVSLNDIVDTTQDKIVLVDDMKHLNVKIDQVSKFHF